MRKEPKIVEVKSIFVDPQYTENLYSVWTYIRQMADYTTNLKGELYRISSFVRVFAYQFNRMEQIRDRLVRCKTDGDLTELRRIKRLMDFNQELKAFDEVWKTVSKEYDELISLYRESSEISEDGYELLTATEILGELYKSSQKYERKEFEKEAQALALEINL